MEIRIRRVYDPPEKTDGKRILVDRLWPRGLSKDAAGIDYWAKDIAPSNELRRWYGHEPGKWSDFRMKYFAELDANPSVVETLLVHVRTGPVAFVYSSRERHLNNAVALKEYIETRALETGGTA